jgi:hypothetical protein
LVLVTVRRHFTGMLGAGITGNLPALQSSNKIAALPSRPWFGTEARLVLRPGRLVPVCAGAREEDVTLQLLGSPIPLRRGPGRIA